MHSRRTGAAFDEACPTDQLKSDGAYHVGLPRASLLRIKEFGLGRACRMAMHIALGDVLISGASLQEH